VKTRVALAALIVASVAGTGVANAGSSSALLTVGVTVVRSCAVDTRAAAAAPQVRLSCTSGARSNLKISNAVDRSVAPAATAAQRGTIVTLNF